MSVFWGFFKWRISIETVRLDDFSLRDFSFVLNVKVFYFPHYGGRRIQLQPETKLLQICRIANNRFL